MDKLYFVNVRDGDPRSWLAEGRNYRTAPVFGPSYPRLVTASQPVELEIVIGEDLSEASRDGIRPSVKLHLELPTIRKAEQLDVRLNGTKLTDGLLTEGWVDYPVPVSALKCGTNQVRIAALPSALADDEWSIEYDGGKMPGRGWSRDRGSERTSEEIVDGSLLIADRGEVSGDYLYYRYPWGADPDGRAAVEARVKVKSGSSFLIASNGTSGERLGLWPDRIELFHHGNLRYPMDTTGDFHLYRMELDGEDLKIYVDGELRIDVPGALTPRSGYTRNEVSFGAANSPMQGEAYWEEVKARATGLSCRDLVVSVSYGGE
jgi:hypothetical protein